MIYPDELPFPGLLKILEQECGDLSTPHPLFTQIVEAFLKDEPPLQISQEVWDSIMEPDEDD